MFVITVSVVSEGEAHKPFPGSSEADFSLKEGGVQSPALSCVNFQNQLHVQHPNNQMWDSHSKPYFLLTHTHSHTHFPWPLKGPPRIWSKTYELPCSNTYEKRDRIRQLDRHKSSEVLIDTFAPGTGATWSCCLWVRLHRSLKYVDECQNPM